MCKVPWVLETQQHVLEQLSAWLADLSKEKKEAAQLTGTK